MDVTGLLLRIAVDVAVVVGWSVVVGATAPRWPARWLARDRGPLRLTRADTPATYRRIGVPRLTRILPEGGAWFGGQSKDRLPGLDPDSLGGYLVEVRRAEWVHLLSILSAVPLLLLGATLGPWWLAVVFVAVVVLVNVPFLLVLRFNRARITRIIGRGSRRATGHPDGGVAATDAPTGD